MRFFPIQISVFLMIFLAVIFVARSDFFWSKCLFQILCSVQYLYQAYFHVFFQVVHRRNVSHLDLLCQDNRQLLAIQLMFFQSYQYFFLQQFFIVIVSSICFLFSLLHLQHYSIQQLCFFHFFKAQCLKKQQYFLDFILVLLVQLLLFLVPHQKSFHCYFQLTLFRHCQHLQLSLFRHQSHRLR